MHNINLEKSVLIDAKNCSTKKTLIDEFVKILDFKDSFSYNWDSFEEIIMRSSINCHIVIYNSRFLLRDEANAKPVLKDIFHDYNQEHDYKFCFIKTF